MNDVLIFVSVPKYSKKVISWIFAQDKNIFFKPTIFSLSLFIHALKRHFSSNLLWKLSSQYSCKEGKQRCHTGFISSHKEPLASCQSETISYCIWWPSILTSSGKSFQEGLQGVYHQTRRLDICFFIKKNISKKIHQMLVNP